MLISQSQKDNEFWSIHENICQKLFCAINGKVKHDTTARALNLLAMRITNSTSSLWVLRCCAEEFFSMDGASILRCIYDATLQALYILQKPHERANDFFDYEWVEKTKGIDWIDSSDTNIASKVRNSPLRPEGEKLCKKEFAHVENNFKGKKGKLRDRWYAGSLRDLAKDLGFESEYEYIHKQLNGAIHSSPLSLKSGPLVEGTHLLTWAIHFNWRVLHKITQYYKISLEDAGLNQDECEVIKEAENSMLSEQI